MSYELNRTPIGDGIHFNSVTHPKFKHNRLTMSFIVPIAAETAADYAVVPLILRKGCREWPDFTSLNARLAALYGAVLDADISKYGQYQVLEVSIRGLDNRFALDNEDIAQECAHLLASIVLDPKLDQSGHFFQEDVDLEQQFLIDSIDAEINDKRTYAMRRCVQIMCAGESVAVPRYGYRAQAEAITPQSAAQAYQRMLQTARIEILLTGSGDPSRAKAIFTKRLQDTVRESFAYTLPQLRTTVDAVKQETEYMDITQGKMVLGMRTGGVETRAQNSAMRVFSAMYGGTPFSKLFLNVREKLSLCYYCASRFDSSTQLLLVDSGVESGNQQKAQDEILVQLAALQNGDFTEEHLAQTKMLMRNSILSTTDSLGGIESWYLAQILREQTVTPAQDAEEIEAVERAQVIAAAKGVALDTVYFLNGTHKEG